MKTAELLFRILRAEVNGQSLEPEQLAGCDFARLYALAKAHDLMYCVTDALSKVDAFAGDEALSERYKKEQIKAAMRVVQIEDASARLKQILTDAKIDFVPLKGARLRKMYPDEMMRTSCDVDILVKEADLARAGDVLAQNGFETDGKKHYHDLWFSYGLVNLELHFSICEFMADIDALLERVWEHLEPVGAYEYHETPEFFAYHHVAHMKYHFVKGGCGVRPFLDLYVMRRRGFYEEQKLLPLLESVGLEKFYASLLQIVDVWFEGAPATALSQKCAAYILQGGVYGNSENRTAANASVQNGKMRGVWHSVFPGYEHMCLLYPALKKHKALLPLCYGRRIAAKLFGKDGGKNRKAVKKMVTQDQGQIDFVGSLLSEMGIR